MPKYANFREASEANSLLPCAIPRCPHHRYGVSKYCRHHRYRQRNWGHPLAPMVLPTQWRPEEQEIRELFKLNPEHPGIKHAADFLMKWMKAANERPYSVPASFYLERLHDHEADPKELLITLAALWLFAEKTWGKKIMNDAHLDRLTGRTVCLFVPTTGGHRITVPAKRDAGVYVRDHIGPLLINIVRSIVRKEYQDDAAISKMNQPLRERLNMDGPLPWENASP